MKTQTLWRIAARAALAVLVVATTGCELGRQGAPPLSGPSSLGLDVTLVATPERLVQDGVSTTTITAVVRDAAGKPVVGLPLEWGVRASDGTFIEPSWRFSPTDANGGTNVVVTAPAAPAALPLSPLVLTVTATPMGGGDSANWIPRQVNVQLVSPAGTLPANNLPVPSFTIVPSTARLGQIVSFDASATTDEGGPCGSCTYAWDFGDSGTGEGIVATHAYLAASTYTVTLTVRDVRGGVASTTRPITVTAPAAPVAVITVSPSGDRPAGTAVFFDASGSTIGAGATILTYTWIWGDGTPSTLDASPSATHTFAAPGTYVVRLIVTDNFGRTETTTATVKVV